MARRGPLAFLCSGWTVVALICVGVFALWAPDLNLPLGNSDDGRIFGRAGIQARNFWELVPVESRFGARTDRCLRGWATRLRMPLGLAAAAVALVTLGFVATGSTRDFYLDQPADAGAVLSQAQETPEVAEAELVWFTSGIWTPRWISYYLDRPIWMLDETTLDEVEPTDVILVRNDRVPDFVPASALVEPLAVGNEYTLITAAAMFN